jgi:DNA polymerase IV
MPALCRDCLAQIDDAARCPVCRSARVIKHSELGGLSIAHVDCDAFYASVEKRDDPALRDRPVIVGGGRRGVVAAACYLARIRGVRSAMPMFEALKRCPEAAVIRPRMPAYVEASRRIRDLMEALTPKLEPLALDEAFLDLTGTTRLHGAPPAVQLARLARRIETEVGVTVSVGLSHNKFLAKIASDLDKPRGFAVIGRADGPAMLARLPVGALWGVGPSAQAALERAGIRQVADLLRWEEAALVARFGQTGTRIYHLARGQDDRRVTPDRMPRSVSNETTFQEDIADPKQIAALLWPLCEKLAARLKAHDLAGRTITLKLKRADHQLLTRCKTLPDPTRSPDRIYRVACALMDQIPRGTAWRLVGVGLSALAPGAEADRGADLLDPGAGRRLAAEEAVDRLRTRFGPDAIRRGRGLTS